MFKISNHRKKDKQETIDLCVCFDWKDVFIPWLTWKEWDLDFSAKYSLKVSAVFQTGLNYYFSDGSVNMVLDVRLNENIDRIL